MADTAAHLVDDVLPRVPVRQWVLSFPHRVRFLLAYHPRLCAGVRRIFVRVVLGWLEERAERDGLPGARSGAVVFSQRFGSALNVNLHFHALVLDGAFTCPSPHQRAFFHPTAPLEDQDVEELVCTLHRRITRYLQRTGHLPRDPTDPGPIEHETEEPLLAQLGAASVQGRVALGSQSGRPLTRLGRPRQPQPVLIPDELCCDLDGFSLHAKILVEADERERLEHLCRYIARPPLSSERLSLAPDGRVIYHLRRHWRDGTAAIAFEPLTFIERLAALVPRPRFHQLTYHGVLAPAAAWRDLVVPRGPAATPGAAPHPSIHRLPWAELLERVFAIDALTCPWCGGPRKPIALLTDGLIIRLSRGRATALPWGIPFRGCHWQPRIRGAGAPRTGAYLLSHLRLPTEPRPLAPARAPPEPAFAW